MVATTPRDKKGNKSRGKAQASSLSQPVRQETASFTAYSNGGEYLASVSLAVDKHKLWVYDTSSGRAKSEYMVNSGRITSLSWINLVEGESTEEPVENSDELLSRKKRKKAKASTSSSVLTRTSSEVIAVGLSNGSLFLFSPSRGEITVNLDHSSNTSPILAITSSPDVANIIWTSSSDGVMRAWDLRSSEIVGQWRSNDRASFTSLAPRPGVFDGNIHILGGHHTIHLISVPIPSSITSSTDLQTPVELASFTGHSSPISTLLWVHSSAQPPNRFISAAEDDRIANLWELPSSDGPAEGRIIASMPVETDIRQLQLGTAQEEVLTAVVSSAGVVALFTLPSTSNTLASPHKSKPISTLSPKSVILLHVSATKDAVLDANESRILAAHLVRSNPGTINIVRLVGQRPTFENIGYLDDDGDFKSEVKITRRSGKGGLAGSGHQDLNVVPTARYSEGSATITSAAVIDSMEDDVVLPGELDVDMAELSLGERLKAKEQPAINGTSIQPNGEWSRTSRVAPIPAVTLTRTLTQALNSSDSKLLETCFAQSNPEIVKETLRKLPPHFSVPLMNALVERLSRGARAGTGKGGGGGASAQRGSTLIVWIRMLLLVHTAHFMTIPDLVSRLSTLHAVLTSRSQLHDKLLALNGRLDLALSQIDLRKVNPSVPRTNKPTGSNAKIDHRLNATHYVEGQSSDEEATAARENESDVEVEEGSEDGSVEDVELGAQSDEDALMTSEEGDEDEENYDEEESGDREGYIDDEAEEDYEEDESSEGDDE
ncbi:Small subunit (SSU) processome component [Tulasnella sp. 419]|nr:Small subunit (SSU) processome component [Tulasnella sp. 419]